MENFLLSAGVVVPLILLMTTGFVVRKTGLMSREALGQANNLVFYIGLPLLCMKNLYESDLSSAGTYACIPFIAAGILLTAALAMLLMPRFVKVPARCGVMIQGCVRSNDAIFGLAVAGALLPADGMTSVLLSVAVSVPLFNLIGVIALETHRGRKPDWKATLLHIFTNPLVIGCAAGLLLSFSGLRLPELLLSPIRSLAGLVTPLAFIVLGGKLTVASLRENRIALTAAVLLKIMLVPLAAVGSALLLGFSGASMIAVLCVFGAPTAMTSYPMAAAMGGDEQLAGCIVAVTSVCSMLTMFFFIFGLKQMGVI